MKRLVYSLRGHVRPYFGIALALFVCLLAPFALSSAQSPGTASLNAAAFTDSNENGERGTYERDIPGALVEVVSESGTVAASALTSDEGTAHVSGIAPGKYRLRFTMPEGYQITVKGPNVSLTSSAVGGDGTGVAISELIDFEAGATVNASAGAMRTGSLSGRAFIDANGNGVIDAGEPGAAGIVIKITGSKTGSSYTLETGESGEYKFGLLKGDMYTVTATLPESFLFARYTLTGGDSRSIFTVEREKTASRQFPVETGAQVGDKNIGVIYKATLSGTAFMDMNYNGIYDEGEPGYPGVTLEMIRNTTNKSMGRVKTGDDGAFFFDDLRGADYRLRAILPDDGSMFTLVTGRTEEDCNRFVHRAGRRENSIQSLTLQNGQNGRAVVGVARAATISGTVFEDKNYDGKMGSGEKRLGKRMVALKDIAGVTVFETTTSAKGAYSISGVMPGRYVLCVERPEGYAFTKQGGDSVITSLRDGFGRSDEFEVIMGQDIKGMNAGALLSSTVSGIFYDDLNDTGAREEGEPGAVYATVELRDEDGETISSLSVPQSGAYFFDGVLPGKYYIAYALPDNCEMAKGWKRNAPETAVFTVKAGQALEMETAGGVTLGTFEGRAFHEGKGALPGVTVTLTPSKDELETKTVVTGGDGLFSIKELRPADYALMISLPEGFIFSGDIEGSGIALDTVREAELPCPWSALTDRLEKAIGGVKPCAMKGYVWLDENMDGSQGQDEKLLETIRLELIDESTGKTVKTARPEADGHAAFENVRPGSYTLRFALPAQSEPAGEKNPAFSREGGYMALRGITLNEGDGEYGFACGLIVRASIGGRAYLNEGGVAKPLPGISVRLYRLGDDEPLKEALTSGSGAYRFDGLLPDAYRVEAALPEGMLFLRYNDARFPRGATAIEEAGEGAGSTGMLMLMMASDMPDENIVYVLPGRIGDMAWIDLNENGLVDAGEPALPGLKVALMDAGGQVMAAETDAAGYYIFPDVYPGSYTLHVSGYPTLDITRRVESMPIITSCLVSGDGDGAQSMPFTIESGEKNFDLDFGFVPKQGQKLPDVAGKPPSRDWSAVYAEDEAAEK